MLLLNSNTVESDVLPVETPNPMKLRSVRLRRDAGERRRGLRVRDRRPVKIFDPSGGRYFGGQTEDLSATGLRIELPAWATLSEGAVLNIHVGRNGAGQGLAHRRSMISARVVWVHRSGGRFPTLEAGIEFMDELGAYTTAA